jgi:sigma factor-binding protein Crl
MTDKKLAPTHFRLLSKLKAIGPYLREGECKEGYYLFDCLCICVDDKKSPEEREFFGWWMELEQQETLYSANFKLGLYNAEGNWVDYKIPKDHLADITKLQKSFCEKLNKTLAEFELEFELHIESAEFSEV